MRALLSALFVLFAVAASAQQAFIGSGIGGAVPGERAFVQLWNPAGSSVTLSVDRISISWGEACISPCANLTTEEEIAQHRVKRSGPSYWDHLGADLRVTNKPYGALKPSVINKDLGSPVAPNAEVRYGSAPFSDIPGSAVPFMEIWTAPQTRDFTFEPPLVVPPGKGIVAATAKPDADTEPTVWYIVDWQWREVPVAITD